MSIAGGPFSATRCSPRWFRRAVGAGWLGLVVAALVSIIVGLLGVVPASAAARVSTYGTVGYTYDAPALLSSPDTAAAYVRGAPPGPEVGSWVSPTSVVGCCVAANTAARGGVGPVRVGQAGEAAVRSAYDIGPKATVEIGGRTRILDGLNAQAVSEVKNVSYQAYTQQLRDSLAYAQQNGLRFDLYVRGGANPTTLSAPLREAIASNPRFNLEFIP